MRQIVLDTETTGLEPKLGHRVIEIGAVEMVNRRLTGKRFHQYINPEREVEAEALVVHGISNEFLQDKPVFKEVAQELFNFIKGAELVIHNAAFDVGFINHEFALCDKSLGKIEKYCGIVDSLAIARKLHPGQKNNLDVLCKRYHVDNSQRDLHGALLDAELLAHVYLAMTGGQVSLFAETHEIQTSNDLNEKGFSQTTSVVTLIDLPVVKANEEEIRLHQERLAAIKAISGNIIWK